MRCLPARCVGVLVLSARIATSTTIVPPTFDELVSQAKTIFVGHAVDRRSQWETTSQGRSCATV